MSFESLRVPFKSGQCGGWRVISRGNWRHGLIVNSLLAGLLIGPVLAGSDTLVGGQALAFFLRGG